MLKSQYVLLIARNEKSMWPPYAEFVDTAIHVKIATTLGYIYSETAQGTHHCQ